MIIHDQRERCGQWAMARIPHVRTWGDWYQCIALERFGVLQAVVVYTHFTQDADIAMSVASDGTHWLTRAFLKACFQYPFVQLRTRRVSACIASANGPSLRFVRHLGFRYEGLRRHGLPDDNVEMFGMLREECRYL